MKVDLINNFDVNKLHELDELYNHSSKIANVVLRYKDTYYKFDYDFGTDMSLSGIEFMFTDGNYCCDCNKSIFIREYSDSNFPEMDCGEKIKLVELNVQIE